MLGRGDHVVLARVALAGRVFLDRADRHALIRDVVVLAPGGQVAHETAVGVGGIHACVPPDFLEVHGVDVVAGRQHVR